METYLSKIQEIESMLAVEKDPINRTHNKNIIKQIIFKLEQMNARDGRDTA